MCWCFRGCWYIAISVTAAHIYGEDLLRVTASRNRLYLSLSNILEHGLVTKINGRRRSQACEVLDWISVDYSCARFAPAPITSPRLASPHPVRRASARVCFPLSPLLHTLASPYRATHLISRILSIFTSKMGLKSYHPPYMNGSLRFIRNYLNFLWAKPNNSNIFV
jgi:hypothetical protein